MRNNEKTGRAIGLDNMVSLPELEEKLVKVLKEND